MPPPDWSSIQEGKAGGEGDRQAVTKRSKQKKRKIKKEKEKVNESKTKQNVTAAAVQHDESYSLNCCCCDVTDKPLRSGATWRLV